VELTFLTPLGALVALGALLPLAALLLHERRALRVRRTLSLEGPGLRDRLPTVVALAFVPVLLGLAAAQPVLRSTTVQRVRSDAEAFYVFDTSDSMRASAAAEAPNRLERALAAAKRIRLSLDNVRSGVATMTDRVLPDVFPTANEQVFTATLDEAVGIDRPPPKGLSRQATTFAALDTLAGYNFFQPRIKHRVVLLFTDGETAPYFASELRSALNRRPRSSFVIIRFWHENERIHTSHGVDPGYRPAPSSADAVRQLASISGGQAFEENQLGQAIGAARRMLGSGPVLPIGIGLHVVALARWLALATLLPLVFLLWRRNLV
jgi:von Willebrand factor type A domain